MILKKSFKNLIRSGGKTALFFLLIFIITVVQCLGIGIWQSINGFLNECDENYNTIGIFEYMGPEYPDENIYDPGMSEIVDNFDFSIIENNENVLLWDREDRALGYIDGLVRKDVYSPMRNNSVVIIDDISDYKRNRVKSARIKEELYSAVDYTGRSVLIENYQSVLENGHIYLVHGVHGYGTTSYRYFTPIPFSLESAQKAGFTDPGEFIVLDITENDGETSKAIEVFEMIARTYEVINNSVSVHATNDLESNLHFHQELLYISNGRSFSDDEYTNGSKVCVVTEFIANNLGISPGDKITMSIAVTDDAPLYESYWDGTGFTTTDEYEVVGICNTVSEYANNVYIPKNENIDYSINQIGYTIGTAVLDNQRADEFYNEIYDILPNRVRLTIYDQGYSATVEPFRKVLRIAVIISLTSILAGLAVVILFGYLYIYRQREVSDIMMKLGSGKTKTSMYFIYGAGIIAFLASFIGGLTGFILSDKIVGIVAERLGLLGAEDRSFSISNLSINKVIEWTGEVDGRIFIFTAIAVLLAALVSCLIFVLLTFRNKNRKKRRQRQIKREGHSVKLFSGSFKYTVISITRSGMRSIITPFAAVAIVLLLSQLTSTAQRYEKEFADFYDNTVIEGQFMDINARYFNYLVVEAYQIHELVESEFAEDFVVTKSRPSHYIGKVSSDGVSYNLEPFVLPDEFAGETLLDKIKRGPKIIFSNSLSRSPEFYYSNYVEMSFADGFDESVLGVDFSGDGNPFCMVSTDFMEAYNVNLGDTIRLYVVDKKHYEIDLFVMGSYVKEGTKDNIYCQLGRYLNPSVFSSGSEWEKERFFDYTFESANFKVTEASKLNDLKAFMTDYGFSEVNKLSTYRTFPILDDKVFISTVESFNQRLRQTAVLYPFIYSLTGAMAFVLSFILVYSRKREMAFMRGLGAVKRKIFASFFMEQFILCILGSGIGLGLWALSSAGYNNLQLILTAGFAGLYCAGSAIAVLFANRKGILSMLGDEE